MYTMILFVVLGIAISSVINIRSARKPELSYWAPVFSPAGRVCVSVFLSLVLGALACGIVFDLLPSKFEQREPVVVYSLKLGESVSGSFRLGTGTIEGRLTYIAYLKTNQGQLALNNFSAQDTLLEETDDLQSTGELIETISYPDRSSRLRNWTFFVGKARPVVVRRVLRVPTGTVKNTFSVN